ncbi:MAG: M14 family zinc carboxypeptidase [Anaerolineae bacterium]
MRFQSIIDDVPDYTGFLTVDELNESSRHLAAEYLDKVQLLRVGRSRQGDDILALRIGDGELTALLFGFPHPNEPIGSMTTEYLARRLAEDDAIREELGYTWYIVKCIDPEGARLNEGWFKGPFNPRHLALNYYRPPGYQQIEWTFPITYKTLKFDQPLPETQALIDIIHQAKPAFMYSLHNSGFGGVYFYVSRPCPPLYPIFHQLARDQGLPLHLGEPEVPYVEKYADAVFYMPGSDQTYDYYVEHTDKDPAEIMNYGTSSDHYAQQVADTFTLVCEMPYYYDIRIDDRSPTEVRRRQAVLEGLAESRQTYDFIKERYEVVAPHLRGPSPFRDSLEEYLRRTLDDIAAKEHWARTTPELEQPATVAELFDNLQVNRFYRLMIFGMLKRLIDQALEQGDGRRETALRGVQEEVLAEFEKRSDALERELDYQVIPIKKLVSVQSGSALYAAEYVAKEKRGFPGLQAPGLQPAGP